MLSALLPACLPSSAAGSFKLTPASSSSPPPAAAPSLPAAQLGPGGLTLDEEVGAVMMVGFKGPAGESVLTDWRQRQFGGLLVVNLNQNATSASSMSHLIASVHG